MSFGFEIGRVYNRRQDIHKRFKGQQQGGIITPANFPVVFLITGDEGLEHGYKDRYKSDGVFEYFGEGQVGDMKLKAGNLAIANHSAQGKSLLLFKKTKEGLRYEQEMVCEGFHFETAPDSNGNNRQAIVFELRALDAITETVQTLPADLELELPALRELAIAATANTSQKPIQGIRNIYQRSKDVRNYVLARAQGVCEGCKINAPFMRTDGTPYLEPHHIRRLSDGGPDHPSHVIALCPNCHRRVHLGIDGDLFNKSLADRMASIEEF